MSAPVPTKRDMALLVEVFGPVSAEVRTEMALAILDLLARAREEGRAEERAAVVAWLGAQYEASGGEATAYAHSATDIHAGEHRKAVGT